jgi:hypothetical protein
VPRASDAGAATANAAARIAIVVNTLFTSTPPRSHELLSQRILRTG